MIKKNTFVDLSDEELERVDGGLDPLFWVGIGAGVLASWAIDGILQATTGKSGADWVSTGIKAGVNWIKSWFQVIIKQRGYASLHFLRGGNYIAIFIRCFSGNYTLSFDKSHYLLYKK